MKYRPGANFVRCAAALALATPITFLWPPFLLLLIGAWIVLAIAALSERRPLAKAVASIEIKRTMPAMVGRDRSFDVGLFIMSSSRVELVGELRDQHPDAAVPRLVIYGIAVPAGGATTVYTTCRIPQRGRHTFGPVWVRLQGWWRLLEAQQDFDCTEVVKVLPETFASREELLRDIGGDIRLLDQQRRAHRHGAGTEFESLYPFRTGDDPRRIDWRASARQQTLVVRRFQVERHRDVMIIIDSGRLMGTKTGRGTKLDCAVDAGLNLARVALQGGDRCGVATFDHRVRGFLPPIAGNAALRAIVQSVYDLDTEWHESDFTPMFATLRTRQVKRTFLIILSDLSDAETSARLCSSLQQLQRQHLVLFAALKTPMLEQIVREPLNTVQNGARKAVTFRLLRDRGRALHALRHHGVHVLDVEPQHLTLPLVNQFVELRQRNLL